MADRIKYHATSILQIYKDQFCDELMLVEEYINESLYQFERKAMELTKHDYTNADDEALDRLDQEYFKNALNFPGILKTSTLISIYSIFEKMLKTTVLKSATLLTVPVSTKKQKGESEVGIYKRLLEDHFTVSILPNDWGKLETVRKIRNIYVHHGGNFSSKSLNEQTELTTIIFDSKEQLLLNEHTKDIIIADRHYLINYCHLISKVISNVLNELIRQHNIIIKARALERYATNEI